MKKFLVLGCLIGLVSCGPTIDQSPEKQAVADIVHGEIMKRHREYRQEGGVRVLAACLGWNDPGAVKVSAVNGYYFPSRYAGPIQIRLIRDNSMGDCTGEALRLGHDCECQLVDENGRNNIAVPDSAPTAPVEVVFHLRKQKPKPSEPEKSDQEKLEDQAGPESTRF